MATDVCVQAGTTSTNASPTMQKIWTGIEILILVRISSKWCVGGFDFNWREIATQLNFESKQFARRYQNTNFSASAISEKTAPVCQHAWDAIVKARKRTAIQKIVRSWESGGLRDLHLIDDLVLQSIKSIPYSASEGYEPNKAKGVDDHNITVSEASGISSKKKRLLSESREHDQDMSDDDQAAHPAPAKRVSGFQNATTRPENLRASMGTWSTEEILNLVTAHLLNEEKYEGLSLWTSISNLMVSERSSKACHLMAQDLQRSSVWSDIEAIVVEERNTAARQSRLDYLLSKKQEVDVQSNHIPVNGSRDAESAHETIATQNDPVSQSLHTLADMACNLADPPTTVEQYSTQAVDNRTPRPWTSEEMVALAQWYLMSDNKAWEVIAQRLNRSAQDCQRTNDTLLASEGRLLMSFDCNSVHTDIDHASPSGSIRPGDSVLDPDSSSGSKVQSSSAQLQTLTDGDSGPIHHSSQSAQYIPMLSSTNQSIDIMAVSEGRDPVNEHTTTGSDILHAEDQTTEPRLWIPDSKTIRPHEFVERSEIPEKTEFGDQGRSPVSCTTSSCFQASFMSPALQASFITEPDSFDSLCKSSTATDLAEIRVLIEAILRADAGQKMSEYEFLKEYIESGANLPSPGPVDVRKYLMSRWKHAQNQDAVTAQEWKACIMQFRSAMGY